MGVEPIYMAYEAIVEPIQRNPQTGLGRFELPKMQESKSCALPLGDSPLFQNTSDNTIRTDSTVTDGKEKKRNERLCIQRYTKEN